MLITNPLMMMMNMRMDDNMRMRDNYCHHTDCIRKTCLYNFVPLKPHFYIVKLIFLIYTLLGYDEHEEIGNWRELILEEVGQYIDRTERFRK